MEVERPTGRHGQQLEVLIEWACVDTGTGRAWPWATSWTSVTQMHKDLKLQAWSMEAARYPLKIASLGNLKRTVQGPWEGGPYATALRRWGWYKVTSPIQTTPHVPFSRGRAESSPWHALSTAAQS